MDSVNRAAVERVESSGIVFLDESTKSPAAKADTGPMFRAKACSATFCPSWKEPR